MNFKQISPEQAGYLEKKRQEELEGAEYSDYQQSRDVLGINKPGEKSLENEKGRRKKTILTSSEKPTALKRSRDLDFVRQELERKKNLKKTLENLGKVKPEVLEEKMFRTPEKSKFEHDFLIALDDWRINIYDCKIEVRSTGEDDAVLRLINPSLGGDNFEEIKVSELSKLTGEKIIIPSFYDSSRRREFLSSLNVALKTQSLNLPMAIEIIEEARQAGKEVSKQRLEGEFFEALFSLNGKTEDSALMVTPKSREVILYDKGAGQRIVVRIGIDEFMSALGLEPGLDLLAEKEKVNQALLKHDLPALDLV